MGRRGKYSEEQKHHLSVQIYFDSESPPQSHRPGEEFRLSELGACPYPASGKGSGVLQEKGHGGTPCLSQNLNPLTAPTCTVPQVQRFWRLPSTPVSVDLGQGWGSKGWVWESILPRKTTRPNMRTLADQPGGPRPASPDHHNPLSPACLL